MRATRAIDDGSDVDYQYRAQRKEFNRQMLYCIVSIIIFFVALITSDPAIVATIPGGGLTLLIIDTSIIVLVLAMCVWAKK